jgi:hypothetical protein
VRTCECNPAAVKAAEELHARSKGYLTSVRHPCGTLACVVMVFRNPGFTLPSGLRALQYPSFLLAEKKIAACVSFASRKVLITWVVS